MKFVLKVRFESCNLPFFLQTELFLNSISKPVPEIRSPWKDRLYAWMQFVNGMVWYMAWVWSAAYTIGIFCSINIFDFTIQTEADVPFFFWMTDGELAGAFGNYKLQRAMMLVAKLMPFRLLYVYIVYRPLWGVYKCVRVTKFRVWTSDGDFWKVFNQQVPASHSPAPVTIVRFELFIGRVCSAPFQRCWLRILKMADSHWLTMMTRMQNFGTWRADKKNGGEWVLIMVSLIKEARK